jgi:hypothetical protein
MDQWKRSVANMVEQKSIWQEGRAWMGMEVDQALLQQFLAEEGW